MTVPDVILPQILLKFIFIYTISFLKKYTGAGVNKYPHPPPSPTSTQKHGARCLSAMFRVINEPSRTNRVLSKKDHLMSQLTHLDSAGHAHMVDVGAKPEQKRTAVAAGRVIMTPATRDLIIAGGLPKGDVLAVARIAGIMAAKKTADIIPLCHPLALTAVDVQLDAEESGIAIVATASITGRTGVEMEALTAVSVAALTIYDMCKAVERTMQISDIRLIRKEKV